MIMDGHENANVCSKNSDILLGGVEASCFHLLEFCGHLPYLKLSYTQLAKVTWIQKD